MNRFTDTVVSAAVKTGRLWISGEMEIPYPCSFDKACEITDRIAEDCGYLALPHGTQIHITGGDISGRIVLDWCSSRESGPQSISRWKAETSYFPERPQVPAPGRIASVSVAK